MSDSPTEKPCASCGRRIVWRKKWARSGSEVRYCSAACRKRGITSLDIALEDAILALLDARAQSASICPSEAARSDLRPLMEAARAAARRLVARGEVVITQGGVRVDPSTAKGAIRLRRAGPRA